MAKDSAKKYKFSSPPGEPKEGKSAPPESGGDGMKTIMIIGILLVLIVIVGGFLVYIITSRGPPASSPPADNQTNPPVIVPPANTTNLTNQTVTNQTSNTTCGDQCHIANALSGANFSECSLVSSQVLAQDCYSQISGESLQACKALSDEAKKKLCMLPFALNDSALCSLLSDADKAECLAQFDPCLSAKDKTLCMAISSKDPGKCGTDTACLTNYSIAMQDPAPCATIAEPVKSKACTSAALHSDRCADLTLDSQRNYCYELYALYTDDYLTCTQINGDNIYSLDCNSYFAARLKNLKICDQDSLSLDTLWACYTNYSLISGDPSGCQMIDKLATTNKFKCSFEFAKKYGDPTACQMISDSLAQRNTCYQGVILYSNRNLDWTKCDGVVNQIYQDKCFIEAAKIYSNVTLCDKVLEAYARESCRSSYASNQTN
jgi:hypothetical protein